MVIICTRSVSTLEARAIINKNVTCLKLNIVLTVSLLVSILLYLGESVTQRKDLNEDISRKPSIADRAFFDKGKISKRLAKSRSSRVLAALPIGNSDEDIERVYKAQVRWNSTVDVDWAFFHYQPREKWEIYEWYNKSVVFTVEEEGFLYGFF